MGLHISLFFILKPQLMQAPINKLTLFGGIQEKAWGLLWTWIFGTRAGNKKLSLCMFMIYEPKKPEDMPLSRNMTPFSRLGRKVGHELRNFPIAKAAAFCPAYYWKFQPGIQRATALVLWNGDLYFRRDALITLSASNRLGPGSHCRETKQVAKLIRWGMVRCQNLHT